MEDMKRSDAKEMGTEMLTDDMGKEDSMERNLRIMEVVEKELNKRKAESTFCFSIFLGATSIWVLLVELWEKLGRPIAPPTMTYGVEIIAIIMFIITQVKTRLKPENLGLNFKNIKPVMIRSVVVSAIIIVAMIVLKLIMKPGEPLLDWSTYNFMYPITSILQEFLARGFLLSCLMNIYDAKHKKHIAVIVSSLLFTTLHLYYGFTFMVGAGLLSALLGYMYLRDKNIWGVSLVHFVFGTMGALLTLT